MNGIMDRQLTLKWVTLDTHTRFFKSHITVWSMNLNTKKLQMPLQSLNWYLHVNLMSITLASPPNRREHR